MSDQKRATARLNKDVPRKTPQTAKDGRCVRAVRLPSDIKPDKHQATSAYTDMLHAPFQAKILPRSLPFELSELHRREAEGLMMTSHQTDPKKRPTKSPTD